MRLENIFKKTRQKQIMNIPFGLGVGLEAKLKDGYEHGQDQEGCQEEEHAHHVG